MNPTPSLVARRANALSRARRPPGARLADLTPAAHDDPPSLARAHTPASARTSETAPTDAESAGMRDPAAESRGTRLNFSQNFSPACRTEHG